MSKPTDNPRILSEDIYSYISQNSNLTKNQVKECFDTYCQMLRQLASSKHLETDLTIALPKVGNFYFKESKGRKKGSTYKRPIKFTKETETIILEEDEPSHLKMKFNVSYTLNDILKKNTSNG